MMIRHALPYAFLSLVLPHAGLAQRPASAVRGVVFDSLRGRPLRNAFVTVSDGRAISTDDRGRFRFDSLPLGTQTFTVQHAVLDSIGLSGLTARKTVVEGDNEVRLAVPSFRTVWGVACGDRRPPSDSGIVYGTVRSAGDGAPVADAAVELTWSDLLMDRRRHTIVERHYRIETRTNQTGGYAICGVALDLGLGLRATRDSSASGKIVLLPVDLRVQRHDLVIGPIAPDTSSRGAIAGIVTDASGQPLAGARVELDSTIQDRTNADGRFELRGIPAGTRQLHIAAIGARPADPIVDVSLGETSQIGVRLDKAVVLPGMVTSAPGDRMRRFAAEFAERRARGFGYSMDSTDIVRYDQFVDVLRSVPSLNVTLGSSVLTLAVPDGKGGTCPPRVMIDGAEAMFGHLLDLYPREVAGLEVYPRASHIPERFVPIGIQPECGMVLVWTKYGMKNR